MVLIVVGLVILGFGVHYRRANRIARDAVPVPGRVVDVEVKRSSLSGSSKRLYGASIEYREPGTGETRVLPPAAYRAHALDVGEQVTLMQDPATGELRLPLGQPLAQMALPFVMGAGFIALGVYELVS